MEPQLGIITTLYYYEEFELSDQEDDCHVNDIVKEDKQGKPINQTMRPHVSEFKDVNRFTYKISFDWALGHRNLDLSIELGVEQIF